MVVTVVNDPVFGVVDPIAFGAAHVLVSKVEASIPPEMVIVFAVKLVNVPGCEGGIYLKQEELYRLDQD